MTNISDEIDALAQPTEPGLESEFIRTRLALAEARRLNAELVEALEVILADQYSDMRKSLADKARTVLAKAKTKGEA